MAALGVEAGQNEPGNRVGFARRGKRPGDDAIRPQEGEAIAHDLAAISSP